MRMLPALTTCMWYKALVTVSEAFCCSSVELVCSTLAGALAIFKHVLAGCYWCVGFPYTLAMAMLCRLLLGVLALSLSRPFGFAIFMEDCSPAAIWIVQSGCQPVSGRGVLKVA